MLGLSVLMNGHHQICIRSLRESLKTSPQERWGQELSYLVCSVSVTNQCLGFGDEGKTLWRKTVAQKDMMRARLAGEELAEGMKGLSESYQMEGLAANPFIHSSFVEDGPSVSHNCQRLS